MDQEILNPVQQITVSSNQDQAVSVPLSSPQFGQPSVYFEPIIPEEMDENDYESNSNIHNVSR